jgi:hypothetical protein
MNIGAVPHELSHEHEPAAGVSIARIVRVPLSTLELKHARASTRCVNKCLHWQHEKKYGGQEDADVVEF